MKVKPGGRFYAVMVAFLILLPVAAAGASTPAPHGEHSRAESEIGHESAKDEQTSEVAVTPASSPPSPDSHDHDHGLRDKTGIARFIAWLGNFHPPMVHFPIAMLIGSAIAEVLLLATGRDLFRQSSRFCLWIGALSAVPTVVLGWFFGGWALVDDNWLLTTHRWIGTLTAIWAVGVLGLREYVRSGAYRPALFLGALFASATGFFGGALVYGLDHYLW